MEAGRKTKISTKIETKMATKIAAKTEVKIEDLTVTFRNKVTAIHHADLEIPKGMFGLLGENGA